MINATSNSAYAPQQLLQTLPPLKTEGSTSKTQSAQSPSFPPAPAPPVFRAVEDVFNLGAETRNLDLSITNLNEPEVAEYLRLTAELLQAGVVGFEDVDVNGRPTRSFVPFEIAEGYTADARPYRGPDTTGAQIDLTA